MDDRDVGKLWGAVREIKALLEGGLKEIRTYLEGRLTRIEGDFSRTERRVEAVEANLKSEVARLEKLADKIWEEDRPAACIGKSLLEQYKREEEMKENYNVDMVRLASDAKTAKRNSRSMSNWKSLTS